MIDERIVYVGVLFNAVGAVSYLVAMARGRVTPNRVTWFLWALAPLVAFAAELDEGVGPQAMLTLMVGAGPAAIFVASFLVRGASWRIGRLDVACGGLALTGIALWVVTQDGLLAIALTIAADALAGVPTIVKAYRYPRTESPWIYWFGATGAAITMMTIDHWNLAHYGFPAYICVVGVLVGMLVTFRAGERLRGRLARPPVADSELRGTAGL